MIAWMNDTKYTSYVVFVVVSCVAWADITDNNFRKILEFANLSSSRNSARSENVMKRDEDGLECAILTYTMTQHSLE